MSTQENSNYLNEDEIDLRELFKTLYKYKLFIILLTIIITLLATIYAYNKTPIYEVKSNIQIGFIGEDLIDNSDTIVKKLNILFNVSDKLQTKNKFVSEVSSIQKSKKLNNFIEVKTLAINNKDALKKNKEVLSHLQNLYINKINQYTLNTKNQIKSIKYSMQNLDNFETKNIRRQIKLLKSQNIAKIDEKIRFYKNIQSPAINAKIKFLTINLKKYNVAVNNLYKNNNTSDSTVATIVSIQMLNYQNLILNSQNKKEDLKIEIEKINNEIIPNLAIKKENIQDDTIRKLRHQLFIDLPNNKLKLNEKIERLKFNISMQNIQNSHLVGNYIVHEHPIKPKKKLIIAVAFITGLILSIFMIFLYNFIRKEI